MVEVFLYNYYLYWWINLLFPHWYREMDDELERVIAELEKAIKAGELVE
jgi:hypothetical protein